MISNDFKVIRRMCRFMWRYSNVESICVSVEYFSEFCECSCVIRELHVKLYMFL